MYYNYTSFYVMEDGSMITHAVEYSYGRELSGHHLQRRRRCVSSGVGW